MILNVQENTRMILKCSPTKVCSVPLVLICTCTMCAQLVFRRNFFFYGRWWYYVLRTGTYAYICVLAEFGGFLAHSHVYIQRHLCGYLHHHWVCLQRVDGVDSTLSYLQSVRASSLQLVAGSEMFRMRPTLMIFCQWAATPMFSYDHSLVGWLLTKKV